MSETKVRKGRKNPEKKQIVVIAVSILFWVEGVLTTNWLVVLTAAPSPLLSLLGGSV